MKIAFFAPSIDPKNGWGNLTREFAFIYSGKFRDVIDFILYLPVSEKNKDYIKNLPFIEKIRFILPEFTFSFRNPITFLRYLKNYMKEPVDLVYAMDFPSAVLAYRAVLFKKIPFIITLEGTFCLPLNKFPDKFLYKQVYKRASKIIIVSKFISNLVIKKIGVDPNKTVIIHNGVNFARFSKPLDIWGLRERFGGKNKKIVLGVGGLKARKGFDIGIKAMAKVIKRVPEAIFIIIGEGSNRKYFESLVEELNLGGKVFLPGMSDGDELVRYYQMADVFMHTPRFINGAFEGFGIIYLEAAAAGKPVVGSFSGGVEDAVVNNKTCILADEENVDETAGALIKILEDSKLAKTLGENGRKWAEQHDWEKIAEQYINVFYDQWKNK